MFDKSDFKDVQHEQNDPCESKYPTDYSIP